jgi:hypothetical protein
MVKVGDSVPNIDLVEGNPGNKVNLSQELGSGLIIGVPAAFSKCPVPPRVSLEAPPSHPSRESLLKLSSPRYDQHCSSIRAVLQLPLFC